MSAPSIRAMEARDLEAVRAILNHYIERTTATFRTATESEEERRAWFATHDARYPAIVVEEDGVLLGWASLSPWKPPGGYRHTAELSVYLREDARGRGLGRRLLAELLERGRAAGHHVVLGGVCTEQEASLRLHESLGFEKVAHLREVGSKFGRWLDVAYYEKRLDSP